MMFHSDSHLLADRPQRPEQMYFDRALRYGECLRDLAEVHVFDESKEKDCALPIGQGGRRCPDGIELLLHDQPCFCGHRSVRHPLADRLRLISQQDRTLPELQPSIPAKVSHQINSDTHKPRVNAAIPTKALPASICPDETILRQSLRCI